MVDRAEQSWMGSLGQERGNTMANHLWSVYLKDADGNLHFWAKCDNEETAKSVGDLAKKEYEAVKGYVITQVF